MIYWFTGASIQAVTTGAYRAVEFIKANIKLEGTTKASVEDSKKVVEICTQYAQKGMFNIFLAVFFATLGFAFIEPYFFIGYLISIALFGLYQAIFMANAGGAWDNAKKIVEVELKAKGTPLHDATVVGDTVGDPFKDTSSVALNPIIKFTTLFGLLAVELAVSLTEKQGVGRQHRVRGRVPGWSRCSSSSGRSTGCGSRARANSFLSARDRPDGRCGSLVPVPLADLGRGFSLPGDCFLLRRQAEDQRSGLPAGEIRLIVCGDAVDRWRALPDRSPRASAKVGSAW